ncbi:MAG TPA: hypothetical protein VGJ54_02825 [Streptosporangiaceae bacterium]|jgi:hypothetical protein
MPGMAGTVMTLSPNMPRGRAERIVRDRVDRDGFATVAVATADARQVAHLERLAGRLRPDDALDCYGLAPWPDGTTRLTVFPAANRAARRGLGWWGEPSIGATDDGLDYWGMPFEPEAD